MCGPNIHVPPNRQVHQPTAPVSQPGDQLQENNSGFHFLEISGGSATLLLLLGVLFGLIYLCTWVRDRNARRRARYGRRSDRERSRSLRRQSPLGYWESTQLPSRWPSTSVPAVGWSGGATGGVSIIEDFNPAVHSTPAKTNQLQVAPVGGEVAKSRVGKGVGQRRVQKA